MPLTLTSSPPEEDAAGRLPSAEQVTSSPAASMPVLEPDPFDPAALRLKASDLEGIGVTRVFTSIDVRKPKPQDFVRAHSDTNYHLDTAVLEDSADGQFYLVSQGLWQDLFREIKLVKLVLAISRHGDPFLWNAVLPAPDGRTNGWHESMLKAQQLAMKGWVRVQSDRSTSRYNVHMPVGNLPEPEWPDLSFREILRLAFQTRFIDKMDHPVLKSLRGEV